jgi:hypothetical protein
MKSVLREPLVHFLLLGALLFAYFEWRGGGAGPGGSRIVVTPGLVEHLSAGFARVWQRPPTEAELKGLVDDHVKEEIATREAAELGLDRDDTIIRRRLRQKLEFLAEDAAELAPPMDAELQAWLGAHPEAFPGETRLALRQVYLSPTRRGPAAKGEAKALLARLRAAGAGAKTETLGDASMLPTELPVGPLAEVTRVFGSEFAARVDALAPGEWAGPLESSYGLHLVLVSQREDASHPTLAAVRPLVEREFLAERRKTQLQALYDRLLQKYTVSIELPKERKRKAGATESGGGR